jgi:hypothetical protein
MDTGLTATSQPGIGTRNFVIRSALLRGGNAIPRTS